MTKEQARTHSDYINETFKGLLDATPCSYGTRECVQVSDLETGMVSFLDSTGEVLDLLTEVATRVGGNL